MNIPMNKNMDEYKDDFYKGMDAKQVGFAVLVILMGGGAFLAAQYIFHVPQLLSVYVAMVFAAPPAVVGFIPVYDMPMLKFLAVRRKVIDNSLLVYDSEYLIQVDKTEKTDLQKKRKNVEKGRKVYFDEKEEGMEGGGYL
nr:PrgI family protein [uncultured Blautia sp.]